MLSPVTEPTCWKYNPFIACGAGTVFISEITDLSPVQIRRRWKGRGRAPPSPTSLKLCHVPVAHSCKCSALILPLVSVLGSRLPYSGPSSISVEHVGDIVMRSLFPLRCFESFNMVCGGESAHILQFQDQSAAVSEDIYLQVLLWRLVSLRVALVSAGFFQVQFASVTSCRTS